MSNAVGSIETRNLTVWARSKPIIRNVNLRIEPLQVFSLIGPSGAGKSTLLRCLNRLIEMDNGLRVEGDILLDGKSVLGREVNVDELRARVGILFQQPVVFPVSIQKNVLFGVRHLGKHSKSTWPEIVERSLRQAALWDEVRDRLQDSALKLSVGQQQRLCLARTLAVEPEVILMDEPTSSLDSKSTEVIESLIVSLKSKRTIVLVTHNLRQAVKVSDTVARVHVKDGVGEIVNVGSASEVISKAAAEAESDEILNPVN